MTETAATVYEPGRGPGPAKPSEEAVFLRNMVEDQRVVIKLRVERLYGGGLDLGAG
ncbi:hypothetical protein [Amycolatopsis sp. NPDC051128]|uniref:hypothetical protein n=1 Tax=Amycolatopsis sp. NPDC051128 TaxID=3155412 RepID=UPI0034344765